jgi:hypothetical protein
VAGVLAGCGRDAPAGRAGGAAQPGAAASAPAYQLQALTAAQARTVAAVAEQIIPETSTPGARAAGVHEFVDRMLAEYHPLEVRERVWSGLARLDARARRRHGRSFADCTAEQQYTMVDALDAQAFGDAAAGGSTIRGGGNENAPGTPAGAPRASRPSASPRRATRTRPRGTATRRPPAPRRAPRIRRPRATTAPTPPTPARRRSSAP